ncbi:MAG: hypothetical protein PS018_20350 [bacterium]|nr:hypothetical protein [bacterium]
MAESTIAPNNKPVTFGAKPAAEPSGALRQPSGAAKSASIRKKAKGAINRGMISEKAAKKFLGNV